MTHDTDHRDDLAWQYTPSLSIPDGERYIERNRKISAATRARRTLIGDRAYGERPGQTLDIFAAQPGAPVHVFVHGGSWRRLDKRDHSFVADALVPAGITTVLLNYDLCPHVTVADMVAEIRAGLRWVYAHLDEVSQSTQAAAGQVPVSISGRSAGAHLVAAALAADSGETVIPDHRRPEVVLISGVYDLEPLLSIPVNQDLRLRPDEVEALSPMFHPPLPSLPLHVLVGTAETPEMIGQSRRFAQVCREQGSPCTYREMAGHNHFSAMQMFEDTEGFLAKVVQEATLRSK